MKLLTVRIKPVLLAITATIFLILGILAYSGYDFIKQNAYEELEQESKNLLTLFSSNLESELAKYEYLPELLSQDSQLLEILKHPSPIDFNQTNRYLKRIALVSGASDVYLMNIAGLTIATSNFDLDRSFLDRNFGFRPYFQQAASGKPGRYFALGITSLQRGFFFAHPIRSEGNVVGVIVVKITLSELEDNWIDRKNHFVVTDSDGIVFLSTIKQWKYRSIRPISSETIDTIRASKRYANEEIRPLAFTLVSHATDLPKIAEVELEDDAAHTFIWNTVISPVAGWEIHSLANTRPVKGIVITQMLIVGFASLITLLLATLYYVNRQRRMVLQQSAALLENRVQKRTHELQKEIRIREKAEQTLRDTQAELVQAAKMAGLGEMSASIGHELNQPITAIQTYTDSASRLLLNQNTEGVRDNLSEISSLTKRMSRTISLLRGFSRKSTGEQRRFSVYHAVEQSLAIFGGEIKQQNIEIHVSVDESLSLVADPVQFNQVLVNLISNALHAMNSVKEKILIIRSSASSGSVSIEVEDNGYGISEDIINNIFDPFVTTKEVGLGLGLGLSISFRIIQNMGGKITVSNLEHGGARFVINLPTEGILVDD